MTNEQFQQWLQIQEKQLTALEKIAAALEMLTPEKSTPNYRYDLKKFPTFDWSSIHAEVERKDRYGAATVIWQGKRYVRRSPENGFGAAIFFTRCIGKSENGHNQYERLITFEALNNLQVRPISREAEAEIN